MATAPTPTPSPMRDTVKGRTAFNTKDTKTIHYRPRFSSPPASPQPYLEKSVQAAKVATEAVETAKNGILLAKRSASAVLDASAWVVKNGINIFNPTSVTLSGDLRGLVNKTSTLEARVQGTFAFNHVDLTVDFVPGQGEEMIRALFDKLLPVPVNGVL